MKTCEITSWGKAPKNSLAIILLAGISQIASAQDGNAGIQQANTQVRSYFESGCNLMYAIGAILGLIGAVKVYSKWMAVRLFANSPA